MLLVCCPRVGCAAPVEIYAIHAVITPLARCDVITDLPKALAAIEEKSCNSESWTESAAILNSAINLDSVETRRIGMVVIGGWFRLRMHLATGRRRTREKPSTKVLSYRQKKLAGGLVLQPQRKATAASLSPARAKRVCLSIHARRERQAVILQGAGRASTRGLLAMPSQIASGRHTSSIRRTTPIGHHRKTRLLFRGTASSVLNS